MPGTKRARIRPEEARDLVAAASVVLDELEVLIRNINRTNSSTVMADGRTLTDALAERDVLRLRHSMLKVSADAASGATQQVGFIRATRSELGVCVVLFIYWTSTYCSGEERPGHERGRRSILHASAAHPCDRGRDAARPRRDDL